VPTYLVQAIVCALVFNALSGVVAVVYGLQVRGKLAKGDLDGAARASRRARIWCWVSVVVGVPFLILLATGAIHNPYVTG
jgi:succinate dehydrogenase/fumarate reductase cytochrome b subunit